VIVDCDFRKWGGIAHWRFSMELLGRDEFGTWLVSRPPVAYTGPQGAGDWTHPFALLIPDGDWWVATFNAPPHDVEIYVDMTTPVEWLSQSHLTAIDLDLDVVRSREHGVFIDDEDEFLEHQVSYAYPDDVIAATRACADAIFAHVSARDEPFGEASLPWLTK
jgi:hypothetical protein